MKMWKRVGWYITLMILVIVCWVGICFPDKNVEKIIGSDVEEHTFSNAHHDELSGTCAELVIEFRKQNELMKRDIHQMKREIVMLRQQMEKPNIKDLIAGVGFIFGLFGVGYYVHARASINKNNRR